jgi:hypothetical protein
MRHIPARSDLPVPLPEGDSFDRRANSD